MPLKGSIEEFLEKVREVLGDEGFLQVDHYEPTHQHTYMVKHGIMNKDSRIFSRSPVQVAKRDADEEMRVPKVLFKRVKAGEAQIKSEFMEGYNRGVSTTTAAPQPVCFGW